MSQKKNWILSLSLALGTAFIMQWQGYNLKTATTPLGIVDLELTYTEKQFQNIMLIWDQATVCLNIWIDFLFIPAYTFFFLTSLAIVSSKHGAVSMQRLGQKLSFFAWLALSLDVIENILMLFSISGRYSGLSLELTAFAAGFKFLSIALILIYLISSLPVLLFTSTAKK